MAYQINGNVIIDNDGNGFFENLPVILTPSIVDPTNGEEVGPGNVTIISSEFSSIYPDFFASRFEVANVDTFAEGNIVYTSGNILPGSNTTTTTSLPANTVFYVRVTQYASASAAATSLTQCFCTRDIPTVLGQAYGGGYYTGAIDAGGGSCYYLIVAPNATGCVFGCRWKTVSSVTVGTQCCSDGYSNTYDALNNSTHPAGYWTATRTIGGFTDWYLPSTNELGVMYTNKGSMPAGEGYVSTNTTGCGYWSSSQRLAYSQVWYRNFYTGGVNDPVPTGTNYNTRAIRRVPF